MRLNIQILRPTELAEAERQAREAIEQQQREADAPPLVDTAQRVMADLTADKPKIEVVQ